MEGSESRVCGVMNDKEDPLKALKLSPMFNLSLGTKELFHSNFLAWLVETYRERTANLLTEMADTKSFSYKDIAANGLRERNHFDFSIWRKKNGTKSVPLVVVENKVKSIAYREQLDRYALEVEKSYGKREWGNCKNDVNLILLTLAKEMPDVPLDKNTYTSSNGLEWHIVDYGTYSNLIRKYFLDKDAVTEEYDKAIITDYCKFISGLSQLADEWMREVTLKADEKMKDLRIDDIRQKIIYSHLLCELKDKMKKDWCALPISSDDFKHLAYDNPKESSKWDNKNSVMAILQEVKKDGTSDKPLVMINLDYGMSGALVQMKFTLNDLNNDLICVIQVQNQGYSIGVEFFGEVLQCPSCPSTYISEGLYPTHPIVFKNIKGEKVDYNKKRNGIPHRYAPSYFYEYCDFDEKASIDDVVNQLIYDLNRYRTPSNTTTNIVPLKVYLDKWGADKKKKV
jgi:hypothetical protein